jgi:hypothetical protein
MKKRVVKNRKGTFSCFRLNGQLLKELLSKPDNTLINPAYRNSARLTELFDGYDY